MKTLIITITATLFLSLQLFSQIATNPYQSKMSQQILIKGVGNVSQSTLYEAQSIVKSFFGVTPQISESIILYDSHYINSNTINGDRFVTDITPTVKTIYVTDLKIFGQNISVRGITRINGKALLIESGSHLKETIIHELGHTFGLYHCNNLSCIMAINNDEYDSGDFCNKCKRIINP
jgi:hypothetical protein